MSDAKRIVPEPPRSAGDESLDVWGFRDSGFQVNAAGQVEFRGSRYAISGKRIPNLLPWGEGIFGVRLDPVDTRPSHYPTALPERVANEALERALAARLPAERVSTDAARAPAPRPRPHAGGHVGGEARAPRARARPGGVAGRRRRGAARARPRARARRLSGSLRRRHQRDGRAALPGSRATHDRVARPPAHEPRALDRPREPHGRDPGRRDRGGDRGAAPRTRLHARPRARLDRAFDARRLDRDERQRHEEEPLRQHRGHRALDHGADAGRRARAGGPARASPSAPTPRAG